MRAVPVRSAAARAASGVARVAGRLLLRRLGSGAGLFLGLLAFSSAILAFSSAACFAASAARAAQRSALRASRASLIAFCAAWRSSTAGLSAAGLARNFSSKEAFELAAVVSRSLKLSCLGAFINVVYREPRHTASPVG